MVFEDLRTLFIFYAHIFLLVAAQFMEDLTVQQKIYKRHISLAIIGCLVWFLSMSMTAQRLLEAQTTTKYISYAYSVYMVLHFLYTICSLEVLFCGMAIFKRFLPHLIEEKCDCSTKEKEAKLLEKTNRNILLSWIVAFIFSVIYMTVISYRHGWSQIFKLFSDKNIPLIV